MKKTHYRLQWLALITLMLTALAPQAKAQETDDLQTYLDQLAADQGPQQRRVPRKAEGVEIPVGLTEVDLSKFTSYQNRTKTLTLRASVKFINGTISAAADYAGGDCLLKVYGGATVVLGETSGVNASAASAPACLAAVGIYDGSTFYQQGDIHQPKTGTGYAIYLSSNADTYCYVSGILDKDIYNPYGGTIKGFEEKHTKSELQQLLTSINSLLTQMNNKIANATTDYTSLSNANVPQSLYDYGINSLDTISKTYYIPLLTLYNTLNQQVQALSGDDDGTLYKQIETLLNDATQNNILVSNNIAIATENIKAMAASDLQQKLTAMQAEAYTAQDKFNKQSARLSVLLSTGTFYFMRQATAEYNSLRDKAQYDMKANAELLNTFINSYNSLLNNHSISTISDVVGYYNSYGSLNTSLASINASLNAQETTVAAVEAAYAQLTVNFPNEADNYSIRPAGLAKEIQLGFVEQNKRGFVLTSSGLMKFEQVSGADFRLVDWQGNYVALTAGNALRGGTKEEAAVWTGSYIGNNRYEIRMKAAPYYALGYEGANVFSKAVTSANSYAWTITQNDMDEGQALFNLLAEVEEAEGNGGSGLTEKDTLVIIPPIDDMTGPDPIVPIKPYVFPVTPYPIRVINPLPGTGYWPIPAPTPGKPRPADFHPIYIPKGSHVIFDDVMFKDLVGGDHVIYVEGTIEINVTINIHIVNWQWFIHVGPGGRVIWRPTVGGDMPRIKNEGTMDIYSYIDYIWNTGTINHYQGTITQVINRYIYHFYGGIVNLLHNFGQHFHEGGTALTARNFEGATFTMRSGTIRNTVVNETDTVFVNRGTFYFYGGIIGGYGSRLIYHGPGATMHIDGGHFEFNYVKHYWIEAHNIFYIRGDYDYGATVPLLLNPGVTIYVMYNWTYKFNIQFIGGLPRSHYALFRGYGNFHLTRDIIRNIYVYVNWTLPNHRWRWYFNETDESIEPRGEDVTDEDDLQAYLDWLAAEQDGEAKSSEEEPQELDLKSHVITLTKPVTLPVGVHVVFRNGTLSPRGTWTHDNVIYIPATTTVRIERVIIDFSQQTHYFVGGQPVQRRLLDIHGDLHFGTGCELLGYFNPSWQLTDTWHPGAVIYVDPEARFFINGGRLDNVLYVWNTVINVYISAALEGTIYVWLPADCIREGFRFMHSWGGYRPTVPEMHHLILYGTDPKVWGIETVGENYDLAIFDRTNINDVNGDGVIDVADIASVISCMSGKWYYARADINNDGIIDVADIACIITKMASITNK